MSAVLETRALNKHFGSLHVTREVSLHLPAGARHALIGPNGAGKTTLVGLISGTIRPDSGTILLNGADVTRETAFRRVRRGLGRTFQITNLFSGLTVLENLFIVLAEREQVSWRMLRPAHSHRRLTAEAMEVLALLGMADAAGRTVAEIAYGDQRLVEIALALCLRPRILLLDEPAAGIPSGEMARVITAIANLPKETAILLIEHDMAIVRQVAQTVSVLVDGGVLATGTPDAVLASDEVKAVYLGRRGLRSGATVPHA
jgi:branched-chain amino acid transport system ATP-binding protein